MTKKFSWPLDVRRGVSFPSPLLPLRVSQFMYARMNTADGSHTEDIWFASLKGKEGKLLMSDVFLDLYSGSVFHPAERGLRLIWHSICYVVAINNALRPLSVSFCQPCGSLPLWSRLKYFSYEMDYSEMWFPLQSCQVCSSERTARMVIGWPAMATDTEIGIC